MSSVSVPRKGTSARCQSGPKHFRPARLFPPFLSHLVPRLVASARSASGLGARGRRGTRPPACPRFPEHLSPAQQLPRTGQRRTSPLSARRPPTLRAIGASIVATVAVAPRRPSHVASSPSAADAPPDTPLRTSSGSRPQIDAADTTDDKPDIAAASHTSLSTCLSVPTLSSHRDRLRMS